MSSNHQSTLSSVFPAGAWHRSFRVLRSVGLWGVGCLAFLVSDLLTQAAQAQPASQAELSSRMEGLDRELNQTVRGWLEEHCTACHEGDEGAANLDLTKPFTARTVVRSAEKWRKLWQRVEAGEMPPPDEAVLTDAEKQVLGNWLKSALYDVACQSTLPRRSPAFRRLTRDEYRRSVEDLTGVKYDTDEHFPADEVGHGFDNLSDLLSVSPLLMEKYLTAAEAIAGQAIVDPAGYRLEKSWDGVDLKGGEGTFLLEQDQVIASGGELTAEVSVAKPGKYSLEVIAWGQQAGDELCEMGFIVDGRQLETCEVAATRRKPSRHPLTLELEAGAHRIGVSFNNDYYAPEHPDRNQRDRNLGIRRLTLSGPEGVEIPSGPRQADLVFRLPDAQTRPAAAARQVLEAWATTAFRREVQPTEVVRLVKLFDDQLRWGATYESALQTCLVAILTSPSFLFRTESLPPPGEVRRLAPSELAQAISFLLWSRPADQELQRVAAEGGLEQPGQLSAQVERLLADSRSAAWLDNFVEQWLYLRILDRLEPRPDLNPPLTAQLLETMQGETKAFVANLVQENRPIRELVNADYTFINSDLAKWYDMPVADSASDWYRVSLAGTPRRGLLGQSGILLLTSNPDRTSPVKRGKWILETLLNQPPPPPAPEVPQLDSQPELTGTLRQRMEQHRRDPNCASCHLKMDALGFALERFDNLGRWREEDAGQAIDDYGELPGGIGVAGATELANILGNQYERQIARGFVEKLLTFALGRGLTLHDDISVAKILEVTESTGFRVRDLIQATIASEAFQTRSGGPAETAAASPVPLPPKEN